MDDDLPRFVRAFSGHAERDGDAVALIAGETLIRFGDLHDSAVRQSARITRLDPAAGAPIGIVATRSAAVIALILGGLLARRPVLLLPPGMPTPTQESLLARAGCRHLVTPDDARPVAGPEPEPKPGPEDPSADLAFLLTTSGSTGTAKIVGIGGPGVDRFVSWATARFGLRPGRSVLSYAPLNFDLSLLEVWATLAAGATVVLTDPRLAGDRRHLTDLIRRHHVHLVQAVPLFFGLLDGNDQDRAAPLDRVRHVVVTGDSIPSHRLARLPDRFPRARLYNLYGCTETNDSLIHEIDPGRLPAGPLPLGVPLPGVSVLLTAEDGSVVSGPGSGELHVSTPFQAGGYVGSGSAATGFGPDPLGRDRRRWFRTGDLVTRDRHGELFLDGRVDFQVKVRGTRVAVQEVERILLEHPEIVEAAVVDLPEDLGGRRLHAVLRRAPGSTLNLLALREHCARSLAPPMIPATMRIGDDALPRTSTGKVDRTAIRSSPST